MTDVISLVGKTSNDKSKADVIALLMEWLVAAKNGEVVSVAISGVRNDGCAVVSASETDNLPALLGAVSLLHYEMMRETS